MNQVEQLQTLLKTWDEWIRQGDAAKVRALCRKFNHKKIPRHLLVDFAQIARRVGAPDLIILWLRPIVRSEKALSQAATDSEKALYALGLFRLGAFGEATQILSEVDPEKDPQVYFYRASLNINQWNYSKAIPDLKKYVNHSGVSAYSKLVGRLNLCAALVSTSKVELAAIEIARLMKKLEREKNLLLKGNLLEIRSQLLQEQGEPAQALRDLDEAAKLLHKADERSILYVQKWQVIALLKSNPNDSKLLAQLQALQQHALTLKEWEIVRDCDLQRALALKDQDLISKVYWGSKFQGYKKRVARLFGEFEFEDSFLWKSHPQDPNSNLPVFDPVSSAPTAILKKFFFILTRELYQPLRITEMIDELYPGEYYHPIASPTKLQRLVARARDWLEAEKYPLQIQAYRNAYRLEFLSPCLLRLSNKLDLEKKTVLPKSALSAGFFRVKDWAQEKSISERTARQQIQKLVNQGLIEMQARGPRTRYRMK